MPTGERSTDLPHPLFSSLELSPNPVFGTDRQNRIVFWNRSAERLLGFASGEVVGRSCSEILEGSDVFGNRYCSETCPVAAMGIRGETARHFILRLRAREGVVIPVDVAILHLVNTPGDRMVLLHILRPSDPVDSQFGVPPESQLPPKTPLSIVRDSTDARARKLSPREVEVLGMLAAGHPTPEIANRLRISVLTARNHIQNILEKLEVHSKAEAVAFAFQKRLI